MDYTEYHKRKPAGFHLSQEYIDKINKLWARRNEDGPRVQKGVLIEEAIDLLLKKEKKRDMK